MQGPASEKGMQDGPEKDRTQSKVHQNAKRKAAGWKLVRQQTGGASLAPEERPIQSSRQGDRKMKMWVWVWVNVGCVNVGVGVGVKGHAGNDRSEHHCHIRAGAT